MTAGIGGFGVNGSAQRGKRAPTHPVQFFKEVRAELQPSDLSEPLVVGILVDLAAVRTVGLGVAVADADEVTIAKADGSCRFTGKLELSARDRAILLADGLMSYTKQRAAS